MFGSSARVFTAKLNSKHMGVKSTPSLTSARQHSTNA